MVREAAESKSPTLNTQTQGFRNYLGSQSETFFFFKHKAWRVFFSPNSGYTEGVLTVRVKAGFD